MPPLPYNSPLLPCLCPYYPQPWGHSVFLRLQKRQDRQWTKQEQASKMVKWNESCWKGTVYIIFSATAFLVTFREKYFMDPYHYWTGKTQQHSTWQYRAVQYNAGQYNVVQLSAVHCSIQGEVQQRTVHNSAAAEAALLPALSSKARG